MKYVLIPCLLAATPSFADCPTGADLANGIRLVETDGIASIYTAQDGVTVEQIGKYPDGYTFRLMLAHGVHVLQLGDLEGGRLVPSSTTDTTYPGDVADLPVPTAGLEWDIITSITYGDGTTIPETQSQVWGEPFEWTVGACTYTTLRGSIDYISEDNTINEEVYFIPDLRISFLKSYADEFSDRETYSALRIEPLR